MSYLHDIKNLLTLVIPYWPGRRLELYFYWRLYSVKKTFCFSAYPCYRLDIAGYEDEWGMRNWKHFELFSLNNH